MRRVFSALPFAKSHYGLAWTDSLDDTRWKLTYHNMVGGVRVHLWVCLLLMQQMDNVTGSGDPETFNISW